MSNNAHEGVNTLTFDLFGTVLDLAGSLMPHIDDFLAKRDSPLDGAGFWAQWRLRQRVEQYQDTIMMLGHSGYLTVCKYAFMYTLRSNNIPFTREEVDEFMQVWQQLKPFDDAVKGLHRLKERYKLVGLSNGEPWYLDHLVKNRIKFDFDAVISVEAAGAFKPHPGVYRKAAQILDVGGARTDDGRLALLRHHGRACLRLPRRLRQPLRLAYGRISLPARHRDR